MGLFEKLKNGLKNTKDSLVGKLNELFGSTKKIDDDFFDSLEETLITADLGVETGVEICDRLRAQVKTEKITEPAQVLDAMKKIISEMISGDNSLKLSTSPSVITMIGVNGAGKTTTVGKLSANLKAQGKKVLVAAADVFRAAAIEQLNVWTDRAGVDIVKREEGSDPAAVVYDACTKTTAEGYDVLIIDTAGRLHNKKNLMDELKKIDRIIGQKLPDADRETLLVLDATTGQNAVNQARLFNEAAAISGIVLTKLDGTAKGGIIIPIRNELNIPVKLVGVGEKLDDLQQFVPEDYAEALLGDFNINEDPDSGEDNGEDNDIIDDTDSTDMETTETVDTADNDSDKPDEPDEPCENEQADMTEQTKDNEQTNDNEPTADITDSPDTEETPEFSGTANVEEAGDSTEGEGEEPEAETETDEFPQNNENLDENGKKKKHFWFFGKKNK
ncbi:MAG: signal recognition particle-docking protein FtsY [Ruminococcaceae bacterium]|nr:signal recognition particle-docking protein FtsY [Oscillospiraceae bacterium]